MKYTTFIHEPAQQHFETESASVLVGGFGPSANPIDLPYRVVGGKLVRAMLQEGWNRYTVPRELGLPWPNLDEGFEVVEQPFKLADATNRMQSLKEYRDAVEFSGDSIAEDLSNAAAALKKLKAKPDDAAAAQEWSRAVTTLTQKHEPMAAVLDKEIAPAVLLKEKPDLADLLMAVTPKTTKGEILVSTDKQLVAIDSRLHTDGDRMRDEFLPYIEAYISAQLFALNGGMQGPVYVINCQNVNDVLRKHRGALIKMLRGIRGACHIDVCFMNRVTGSTGVLQQFGSEMDKHVRGGVWATMGGIANEAHAIKFAENNPIIATEGAGNVFAYLGTIPHRGYHGVASAAQLGKQVALDRRFNEVESGPMTHHFGPQSNKHLDGVDGDLMATSWDTDTLKMLARESGLNVPIKHDNGVVSPYLARTQSSLTNYRFINGSRLANILSGAVMQYMNVAAPAAGNTPAMRRTFCEQAEELFFDRFKHCDGFSGSITPLATSKGTKFELGIEVRTPDPIEEIVVVRRNRTVGKSS